jgi:hypothetical protein
MQHKLLFEADQAHYQRKSDDFFSEVVRVDQDGNGFSEEMQMILDAAEQGMRDRVRKDIEDYKASVKKDEELQTAIEEEGRISAEVEETTTEEVDATDNNVDPETGEQVVVSPVDEQPVEEVVEEPAITEEPAPQVTEPGYRILEISYLIEEAPESVTTPEPSSEAPASEPETATSEEAVAPVETPEEATTSPAESGNASVNADE